MRGVGPADVGHKANREGNCKFLEIQKQILQTIGCFHNVKHKFKCLHEAWCMLQELKQDRSHEEVTFWQHHRLWWGRAGHLHLPKPRSWKHLAWAWC